MLTLIRTGQVITNQDSRQTDQDLGILIKDNTIDKIGKWQDFADMDSVQIIDVSRYTVMPALVDSHTHVVHTGDPDENWMMGPVGDPPAKTAFVAAQNARRHIEMGVTTIRDLGARDWVDLSLRDAVQQGWQVGPRMLVAGHGITTTGGHMDPRTYLRPGIPLDYVGTMGAIADSDAEARRAVRLQLAAGVDVIKINATISEYVRSLGGECTQELTFEQMRIICEIAHEAGRRVTAHCHGGKGVDDALRAGVDSLEHGRFLSDDQMEKMASQGVFLIPTLSPEARSEDAGDIPKDPAYRTWREKALNAMYNSVERAHQHGVKVAAGSDAGMPRVYHGGVAYEAYHLTKGGLSNLDAIKAMTQVGAEALGLGEKLGKLAPGYSADLIAVEGNPAQDLRILQDKECIKLVMQDGVLAVDRR